MSKAITPNQREGLSAQSTVTGEQEYLESTGGALLVVSGAPTPGITYDYIDVQQTSPTVDTYVFKTGGAGGTTVQTIVVTYTSSSKENLDTVAYS